MKVSKATKIWIDYHKANSRKNTVRAYEGTIFKFIAIFGDKDIADIDTDDILSFLTELTNGRKQQTKKSRYSHLKSFFSFAKTNLKPDLNDPCDNLMVKKIFRTKVTTHRNIIDTK